VFAMLCFEFIVLYISLQKFGAATARQRIK